MVDLLQVTNIRVEFLKLHTLGDERIDTGYYGSERKYFYSMISLMLRGSCSCFGHASECLSSGLLPAIPGKVYGQCKCEHNTGGMNCEQCLPFYQDVPWRPASEDDPSECKRE